MEIIPILLLLVFTGGSNAFVYSSNEIKYEFPKSNIDSSTRAPPTPIVDEDPYCGCALSANNIAVVGWSTRKIWLDVVIVVDTSEAVENYDLGWAWTIIEAFFNSANGGGLTTETRAQFYTRIGLITVADEANVQFSLNMTKADMQTFYDSFHVTPGVSEMNFEAAFESAFTMLQKGRKPGQATARQVIYFMTDSEPKGPLEAADQFKDAGGIIIVVDNNYVLTPGDARPGLIGLASPGYYSTKARTNQMIAFQMFCKANCYCRSDIGRVPYKGHNLDPAVSAAGGCFRAEPTKNQFLNARNSCNQLGGGQLVSIHDPQKGAFVQELMSRASPKSSYFWIGYTRTDAVTGSHWDWDDNSTNPYTNWADHQPGKSAYSKCAYVETATSLWGDGNCNIAYPSVCEFAPCEVGNKNC